MAKRQYREFSYLQKEDYDKKFKVNDEEAYGYSKKKLKDKYPNEEYQIAGETYVNKKCQRDDVGRLDINRKILYVSEKGKISKLFKKPYAFLEVAYCQYVTLLKTRIIPIILLIGLICSVIGSSTYLLYKNDFFKKEDTDQEILKPDYELVDDDENQKPIDGDENTNQVRLTVSSGYVNFSCDLGMNITSDANLDLYFTIDDTEYHLFSEKVKIENGIIQNISLDMTSISMELKEGTYDGRIVLTFPDGTVRELEIEFIVSQGVSGSIGIGYKETANVDLSTGNIEMELSIGSVASHNVIVQLVIVQGDNQYVIAQSGKVNPGYKIETMTLLDEYKDRLTEGVYNGKYLLNLYGDDGSSFDVVPEIEVDINVRK